MLKTEHPASAKLPARSGSEKMDATTRAALQIINQETAARDAKTARLKALRLEKEREAEEAAIAAKPAASSKSAASSKTAASAKTAASTKRASPAKRAPRKASAKA